MNAVQVSIYSLCLATCIACAYLLIRGYRRGGARLLLWTGLCFSLLSLNNLAVLLDLVVFIPEDLQGWRLAASAAAVTVLIVGLVMESE
jgi:hypothetical protein